MIHITSAATATITRSYGIRVEINQPTVGTITIADAGTTMAVIAASTAASAKVYYGFTGAITITNASTEDITVSMLNRQGG